MSTEDTRFVQPLLTPLEAARHLNVPESTVLRWAGGAGSGDALIHRVKPRTPRSASLPFIAVVEVHVLRALRESGLTLREIGEATTRLRRELGTEYALASSRLGVSGRDLLVHVAQDSRHGHWERARDGQRTISEVLREHMRLIDWRTGDEYPFRLHLRAYEGATVIIDPAFSFGQPVFADTKVRVEDVTDAFWAGERIADIAREFGVTADEVEAAVRALTRPNAA